MRGAKVERKEGQKCERNYKKYGHGYELYSPITFPRRKHVVGWTKVTG
jgi:hypothetical protein